MIIETINIKPSKIKEIISSSELEIVFESGEVLKLSDYHDQDCCENVYADFEAIISYIPQLKNEYDSIIIDGVEGIGFKIGFKSKDRELSALENVLIPCYNSQNGYYSDKLDLIIVYPNGEKKKFDITDYKKDDID